MGDQEQLNAGGCPLEEENMRQYDEKSGLWYLIHWDDVLQCYVTQLAPGQNPSVSTTE